MVVPAMISLLAITLAGCGKAEDNKDITASVEPEEKPVEELSTEEWIESIKTDDAAFFFIFNETTGIRKILEDGEEYQVSDGDVLGFWKPLDWKTDKCSTLAEAATVFADVNLSGNTLTLSNFTDPDNLFDVDADDTWVFKKVD